MRTAFFRLVPAARQIVSACARISRSSALTGIAKNGCAGSRFAAGDQRAVAHRHQSRDEQQIAGADRRRAALEQRRNRRDDLLRGLAVFGERDGVYLDARFRHDEAGRRGGDDRRRGLDRKMLRPDLAKTGNILLIAQIDLRLHHGVEAGVHRFERRLQLAPDDEVCLQLDRRALPESCGRVAPRDRPAGSSFFERFRRLAGHKAEVAGAERRAVAGAGVDLVGAAHRPRAGPRSPCPAPPPLPAPPWSAPCGQSADAGWTSKAGCGR